MSDTTGEFAAPDLEDDSQPVPSDHLPYAPPGSIGSGPITPPPPGPSPSTTSPWEYRAGPRPLPEPAPARRTIGTRTLVLVAALAGILGAALSALVVTLVVNDGPDSERIIERVETQIVPASADGLPRATAVARRVLPSIVTVEVGSGSGSSFVSDGSGSGVVLDAEAGILVTNQHVVDQSTSVRVIFASGRAYAAEVLGEDQLTDVAVLRIAAEGLTSVEIGSANSLEIGDTAIAIGSPLGLEGGPSVTVGVVSAFDRRVRTNGDSELFGMLQTDAPITRGSSGGALVDAEGRLIGITTAIGVSDVGAEGLGFAIPVEMVTRITDELLEAGRIQHAFLGITGTTFFAEEPDGASIPAGVVVASVLEGSAAALAGLEAGDVIHSFAGEQLFTMEKLVVDLRFYRVGEVVTLEIERAGDPRDLDVTLLARPDGV